MKKVILTGATGLIGRNLIRELFKAKYPVIALVRDVYKARKKLPPQVECVEWDYKSNNINLTLLENSYSVIHLAGAGIFDKRWNEAYKKEIYSSRVDSTKLLIDIISKLRNKPENFIGASAVGYYGNRGDEILTEDSKPGNDFLAKVCVDWEQEASKVTQFGVRWASIRTGIVLSKEGGALKKMLPPFKIFLGGPLGSGNQYFPWIHIKDILGIILYVMENKNCVGPINAAAPHIVTMKEFAKELGKVLKRPALFSVPEFALRILLGEAASDIVSSQRINSEKIINLGYKFNFPYLTKALIDLIYFN
ncbi:MAG: TIGR01777 family oxidoreductase [Ignavibacterium sp.]|nr:TIGR01777 family oxidoreductase [Ignavibacterium sp.]MDW8375490.1 TIGR01777 family oxidoreductase [Ignavibacteriales bacterium]